MPAAPRVYLQHTISGAPSSAGVSKAIPVAVVAEVDGKVRKNRVHNLWPFETILVRIESRAVTVKYFLGRVPQFEQSRLFTVSQWNYKVMFNFSQNITGDFFDDSVSPHASTATLCFRGGQ